MTWAFCSGRRGAAGLCSRAIRPRTRSSWARGQSWALYGFGTAYRFTGDRRFLATAQDCADFYVDRTGDRLVPPNDWEEPSPVRPWESSAAAIAAGGLWQLAGLTSDPVR